MPCLSFLSRRMGARRWAPTVLRINSYSPFYSAIPTLASSSWRMWPSFQPAWCPGALTQYRQPYDRFRLCAYWDIQEYDREQMAACEGLPQSLQSDRGITSYQLTDNVCGEVQIWQRGPLYTFIDIVSKPDSLYLQALTTALHVLSLWNSCCVMR